VVTTSVVSAPGKTICEYIENPEIQQNLDEVTPLWQSLEILLNKYSTEVESINKTTINQWGYKRPNSDLRKEVIEGIKVYFLHKDTESKEVPTMPALPTMPTMYHDLW
jgi:hypothetical protein